ncbi:NUDIX domain-containing protein [Micromonospora echinospora]|uniref:NUDIX domain-containing protein n=1 Tax=Micromonospora echinospora TaxID=1877 RepID=UPI00366BE3F2
MTANKTPPMATPRVASGALFLDGEGRVLLVRPTYKKHWEIPGGYVEPGESPRSACNREVQEELGLKIKVGRMLVVDWAPAENEGDKLLFIFDANTTATVLEQDICFSDGELSEWRYVSTDDLEDYVPDRLARRVRTAVEASGQCKAAYAEHGIATE